ncbi:MAG: DUF5916 domain-containing protein [Pyrinomonadaceae bacterium]
MKYLFALIFGLLLVVNGSSQTLPPTPDGNVSNEPAGILANVVRDSVTIPKFTRSPVIDGRLDDEMWQQAVVLKDFIQTSPGDNISPSKPTEVYIGYDESFLYVAFKCWDEKDKIRASVVQRDDATDEDNVRFWLDTYDDQRRAYFFAVNPLGIQEDGVFTEGRGTDEDVDILFESKGVVENWGWSVEIKIPFKSIRYVAGKGKSWGFNAARTIARLNNESNSWVAQPRGVSGFLNKFGKITGLDDLKTERTLEIIPTFTLKETGTRTSLLHFSNPPVKASIGFTAKYSISPNVTLDLAIHPDFADTEADAPVVQANQRFPIFFSEKRPFFLEGVDIFRTQIQAVYTRRVQSPDVAVKLTGKIGKNSFGIFGAVDDPLSNPFNKKALVGVVRLKRDVGSESEIGFLATSYKYPERHNQLAGFDTRWKIDTKSQFRAQILGSTSRRYFYDPETNQIRYQTGNGVSHNYQYSFNTKNYGWGFGGDGTSDKFRADVGFTRRTNSMQNFVFGNLNSDPSPHSFILRKSLNGNFGYRNDFSGRLQGWGTELSGSLNFEGNSSFRGGISVSREKIYEDEFGPKRNATRPGTFFGEPFREAFQYGGSLRFSKEFNKRVSLSSNLNISFNTFDFDFGAGRDFPRVSPAALALGQDAPLDPGKATGIFYGVSLDLKPTDKFSLEIEYEKSRLRRNATKLLAYDSNNFSVASTYQFSRFVNVKARVFYDTLSDEIFGQYTFGWTPSVGKSLYIGYNSRLTYNGYAFEQPQTGILQLDRTFFIKMSYLFRKSF